MESTSEVNIEIQTEGSGNHDELIMALREYLQQQPGVRRAEPVAVHLPGPDRQTRTGIVEAVTLVVTLVGTAVQAIGVIQQWLAQRGDGSIRSVTVTNDGKLTEIFSLPRVAEADDVAKLVGGERDAS
jgi:hypothetical protein